MNKEYNTIDFKKYFNMIILHDAILYTDNDTLIYINIINEDNEHLHSILDEATITLISTKRMLIETEFQAGITIFFNMQTIKKQYIPLKIKKIMAKYIKTDDLQDIAYLTQFTKNDKFEEQEIFL